MSRRQADSGTTHHPDDLSKRLAELERENETLVATLNLLRLTMKLSTTQKENTHD